MLSALKDLFIDISAQRTNNTSISEFKTVKGAVSDENGYLSDVTVISRGNNTQTITDSLGELFNKNSK